MIVVLVLFLVAVIIGLLYVIDNHASGHRTIDEEPWKTPRWR